MIERMMDMLWRIWLRLTKRRVRPEYEDGDPPS